MKPAKTFLTPPASVSADAHSRRVRGRVALEEDLMRPELEASEALAALLTSKLTKAERKKAAQLSKKAGQSLSRALALALSDKE